MPQDQEEGEEEEEEEEDDDGSGDNADAEEEKVGAEGAVPEDDVDEEADEAYMHRLAREHARAKVCRESAQHHGDGLGPWPIVLRARLPWSVEPHGTSTVHVALIAHMKTMRPIGSTIVHSASSFATAQRS